MAEIAFLAQPKFYSRSTEDGVPYWKIARPSTPPTYSRPPYSRPVRGTGTGKRRVSFVRSVNRSRPSRLSPRRRQRSSLKSAHARRRARRRATSRHDDGTPATDDRGRVLARVRERSRRACRCPCRRSASLQPICLVSTARRRGRGCARIASGSGERAGSASHHARKGRSLGVHLFPTLSRAPSRFSAEARSRLTSWRPR